MREHRLGRLLIVGQTALTVMLLIGAGLLVKSFVRLQQIDLGVNTRQALTADLLLSKRYAEPGRREAYVQLLLEGIGRLPGVLAVAAHVDQPFTGGGRRETFRIEGHDDPHPEGGHSAAFNIVSGLFFNAMDIAIVRGRAFNEQDSSTGPPVAIINETMARQFWPGGDAIGRRIRFYYDKKPDHWLSIVGVVRDVRYRGRLMEPVPQVFMPSQQPFYKQPGDSLSLVVRTAGTPSALVNAVRDSVWSVDKDQPVSKLQPMERVLSESAAAPRVYMVLLGSFAIIALLIACAGIYSLSAYAVVRRTREIGVRLALGATPPQVLRLVLRQGVSMILIGACLGLAGAFFLTKSMSGFLYGITATDAPTFGAVLLLFAAVAFVSTYLPARRATSIDPTVAFRSE